jgi:hypothetical protein
MNAVAYYLVIGNLPACFSESNPDRCFPSLDECKNMAAIMKLKVKHNYAGACKSEMFLRVGTE